jgi:hypothetical protein
VDHEEMRKEGKDPLDEYNKRFDDQNDDNDVEYEGENNNDDDDVDVEDEKVIMDFDNHVDVDNDDDDGDIVRHDALEDEDAINIDVQKGGR